MTIDWLPEPKLTALRRVQARDIAEVSGPRWSSRSQPKHASNSSFFHGFAKRFRTVIADAAVLDGDVAQARTWLPAATEAAAAALRLEHETHVGDISVYSALALIAADPTLSEELTAIGSDRWNVPWVERDRAHDLLSVTLLAAVRSDWPSIEDPIAALAERLADASCPPSTSEYLAGLPELAGAVALKPRSADLEGLVATRNTAYEAYIRARLNDITGSALIDWRGLGLVAAVRRRWSIPLDGITATFLPSELIAG